MPVVMRTLAAAALMAGLPMAIAQGEDGQKMVTAQEIQWSPGPASLPAGAQVTTLYGDASKEGLFAIRLKLPAGYVIPPHTHPRPEVVTVISGTFHLGMGEMADRTNTKALPAGSFFAFAPGMAHFAFMDEETVVQLNSIGPWGLNYVNPADDPRRRPQ
jgi:quercetin dioxygenase-like cupin family protein